MEYLLPAHCRTDIYNIDKLDDWTECAKMRAFYGFAWSLGLLIVVILLLMYFWFSPMLFFAGVFLALIVAATAINYGFYAEWKAKGDFQTLEYDRKRIADRNPGISKGDIDEEIKKERYAKMQAEAVRYAADRQANAMNQQALATWGVANALRQPRRRQTDQLP